MQCGQNRDSFMNETQEKGVNEKKPLRKFEIDFFLS